MNQIELIAERIRDLREISGFTCEQVAQKANISLDEYEAYEKGTNDFSFSHLFNIANVLGVDISDLLTGESPRLKGYCVTRLGKGYSFTRRKQYNYQHLAYNFKDKLAEPFIVTVTEDTNGTTRQSHSHSGQELNYVLEGKLHLNIDGNDIILLPGDSIYYDSRMPHVMYAIDGDCKFLAVVIKEERE